jgi:AcrR family transcriptional regulator
MRTADPELRERRREQILAAAGRCFVKKGFHQTSMAEIAAASQLSMGLLYRYFKDKNALVVEFARRERAESVAALSALSEAKSLRAGISAYLEPVLDAVYDAEYVALATEILAESARNAPLLDALRREDAVTSDALRTTLGRLAADAVVTSKVAPQHLAMLLTALTDGLALRVAMNPTLERKVLKSELLKAWLALLAPH